MNPFTELSSSGRETRVSAAGPIVQDLADY
jgi:hypothetical protein